MIVATPTADGVVTHTASVSGGESDPLLVNNNSNASASLTLPAAGVLSIANVAGQNYVNWLSAPPTFQLERTSILGPAAEWSPILTGIFNNGTMKTWIVTNGSPATGYFRLRQP